jgi:hypothetical protein
MGDVRHSGGKEVCDENLIYNECGGSGGQTGIYLGDDEV